MALPSPSFPPVAVTGIGVVSSVGNGFDAFSRALMTGASGYGPVTAIDAAKFRTKVACEARQPPEGPAGGDGPVVEVGRAARFALAAARMAVDRAFHDKRVLAGRKSLVSIGTSDAGAYDLDRITEGFVRRASRLDRSLVARVPAHKMALAIAADLELRRVELLTNGAACSAGNQAIGLACDAIQSDGLDFAIAGGADALCRRMFAAFSRLNLMAPEVCQPFDSRRQGLILGEGSAMLVLEDAAKARARGATIYAQIVGYATNCDRSHPVRPTGRGIVDCMRAAHHSAGLSPEEVDLISAHGTGTPVNDVVESRAIKTVFGSKAPAVTAIKSMIGHTMGAAGAMGAVACIAAIGQQRVPPTINHYQTDPECEVDCVPNRSRPATITYAQNNSIGFFGNNVVVMIKRPDGRRAGFGARTGADPRSTAPAI